jgi:Xaa-Pro aminopeptidase
MLTIEGCCNRQRRVASYLNEQGLDAALFFSTFAARHFSGATVDPKWPQVVLLTASGECLLVTNRTPPEPAACQVETYTGYSLDRDFNRVTATREVAHLLAARITPGLRIGIESDWANDAIVAALGVSGSVNITPAFTGMRRSKDPDELDCMRAVISIAEAGYAAAKANVRPGIPEYELYGILLSAMIHRAGTSVTLGGDFTAGAGAIRGGPPTSYRLQPGDLYILDIIPTRQGYFCDLCRTFAAGEPSDSQSKVWKQIIEAHEIAANLLRPGVRGCDIYQAVKAHLDRLPFSFPHHAGHGVGMQSWEPPWLTPGSSDVLLEGEVVAVEPGLYDPSLGGGVRLEHNYLVTRDGGVPLDSFAMAL